MTLDELRAWCKTWPPGDDPFATVVALIDSHQALRDSLEHCTPVSPTPDYANNFYARQRALAVADALTRGDTP